MISPALLGENGAEKESWSRRIKADVNKSGFDLINSNKIVKPRGVCVCFEEEGAERALAIAPRPVTPARRLVSAAVVR